MTPKRSLIVIALLACWFSPALIGRVAGEEPPAPELERDAGEWVARLGSDVFEDREEAFAKLFQLGETARQAIETASRSHADFEVRLRCQELLGRMSRAELEARLEAFIAEEPSELKESDEPLPGWYLFREIAGGEREARAFFAAMTRAETALLSSIAGGPEAAARALAERMDAFAAQDAQRQFATEVDAASAATLILAGAARGKSPAKSNAAPDARELDRELAAYLSMPGVARALAAPNDAKQIGRLLDAWIDRRRDIDLAPDFLAIASQYGLADTALRIARESVENKESAHYHLPDAILAAGRFGDASDISRIEPLLDNDRLCHTLHRNNEVIRIEVRDVALAVLWRLSGVDPKEKGFEQIQPVERTLYAVYSLGFDSDEKREAAHQLWRKRDAAAE